MAGVNRFAWSGRRIPDRLLEEPGVLAWNRRDDYMPYWAYLWPGAFLLAEAVAREPWPKRARGPGDRLRTGTGRAGGADPRASASRSPTTTRTPLDFVARSASANGFDPRASRPPGSTGATRPRSGSR